MTVSYVHSLHAAAGDEQRRLLHALADRCRTRPRPSAWAPLARAAWEAGVPEAALCAVTGRDRTDLRQLLADELVAEHAAETRLRG